MAKCCQLDAMAKCCQLFVCLACWFRSLVSFFSVDKFHLLRFVADCQFSMFVLFIDFICLTLLVGLACWFRSLV